MATWAPKTYPTKPETEERMACPAFPPPSKRQQGGATKEWCLQSRGKLAACAGCDWGKNAQADTVRCVQ